MKFGSIYKSRFRSSQERNLTKVYRKPEAAPETTSKQVLSYNNRSVANTDSNHKSCCLPKLVGPSSRRRSNVVAHESAMAGTCHANYHEAFPLCIERVLAEAVAIFSKF
jgi:hypothetical protein